MRPEHQILEIFLAADCPSIDKAQAAIAFLASWLSVYAVDQQSLDEGIGAVQRGIEKYAKQNFTELERRRQEDPS